jgi:hypothetical protein
LKYNDLLNKHFALAAQKTEDTRESKRMGPDGQYYGGANIGFAPVPQFHPPESTGKYQPMTAQHSLDPP